MSVAISFDLEYDGDKLLCACTAWTNGVITVPQLWSSSNKDGFTELSTQAYNALLESLWNAHCSGVIIITWGGTGSDWTAMTKMAKNVSQKDKIKLLAKSSVDIPLISASSSGMMMGLVAASMGMGFGARNNCDSEHVPLFWNSKDPVKQNEVLQHVIWDAMTCAAIYNKLYFTAQSSRPSLHWITQKSGPRTIRLPRTKQEDGTHTMPTVSELLTWPDPVTNFKIPDHLNPKKIMKWLE
jgi:hypothetical protein